MNRRRMRVWVVTGPAGAGKSTVTGILAQGGAAVVDGDRLGHELLAEAGIQAEISARLGNRFVAGGAVDRAALGSHVFGDPAALAVLNDIMHGPLAARATQEIERLAAAGQHGLAVFEAAVYFLLPSPPRADLVVAVTASPAVRAARLVARPGSGLTEAQALERVRAQAGWESLWPRADEIIVNEGSREELEARVRDLVNRLATGSENLP